MPDACPHCPDGHDLSRSKPWGVYVAPTRDGDGKPTILFVAPSGGSHVAESDAEWIRGLINGDKANATEIINEILAPLNGRLAAAEAEGLAAHQRAKKAEAEAAGLRSDLETAEAKLSALAALHPRVELSYYKPCPAHSIMEEEATLKACPDCTIETVMGCPKCEEHCQVWGIIHPENERSADD
ncbi:MAG: hypothetical protein ABR585_07520 [Gemmatimonadaceae bacterium]